MNTSLENIYKDHQVKPYISPDRDIEAWLLNPKPVSKRNMELLEDNLLAGDIPSYGESSLALLQPKHDFKNSHSNMIQNPLKINVFPLFQKTNFHLI